MHYYGTVPTGFTVIQIGQRLVVKQFPDHNWYRLFGRERPSDCKKIVNAMLYDRDYRCPWSFQDISTRRRLMKTVP